MPDPIFFAVGSDFVYWTERGEVITRPDFTSYVPGRLFRAPKTGGTPSLLYEAEWPLGAPVVDEGHVYVPKHLDASSALIKLSKADGTVQEETPAIYPIMRKPLVLGPGHVYAVHGSTWWWEAVQYDKASLDYRRIDRVDDAELRPPPGSGKRFYSITTDGDVVYWWQQQLCRSPQFMIERTRSCGGAPILLWEGDTLVSPEAFDDRFIYGFDHEAGAIVRIPK